KEAEAALDEMRTRAAGATSLDESKRLLETVRETERVEAAKLPELERASGDAEDAALAGIRERAALATQRVALLEAKRERARRRERHADVERQLASIQEDLARHRQS